VSNPYWPNVVLKTGAAQDVLKEAQRLDALRHPNIMSLVGIVNHTEATVSNGQPAAFLALERTGPSLEKILKTSK